MLDFSETVDDNATRETLPLVGLPLPPSLTWVAKWLAEQRFDVRWDELDYLADTSAYAGVPFLVFHGTEDTTVPIATSRELAELLPNQVTLVACPEADHIECWNVDAEAYADEVLAFLERVGA
jgi:pimeloyl-ACP methyl ester carboxylesterase